VNIISRQKVVILLKKIEIKMISLHEINSCDKKHKIVKCFEDYCDDYIEEFIDDHYDEEGYEKTIESLRNTFLKIIQSITVKEDSFEESDYMMSFEYSFSIAKNEYLATVKLCYNGTDEGDGEHVFSINNYEIIWGNMYLNSIKTAPKEIMLEIRNIYSWFNFEQISLFEFVKMLYYVVCRMHPYPEFNKPLDEYFTSIDFT